MNQFRQAMQEAGFSQKQMEFFETWKTEIDTRLDDIEELVDTEGEEDNDE